MIVIIEGPDGAGKTHLAQLLASTHQLRYHHEGPPPQGVDPLYHYGSLLEQARATGASVVFDRFALGERVYGPLLRGHDALGEHGWRVFSRLLRASGAHHVLCLPPMDTCYTSWASGRAELFSASALFQESYRLWARLAREQTSLFDMVFDYTKHRLPWFTDKIMWQSPVIGSPFARYLIVGDRGSDPTRPTDLAFFGVTNSARYLTRALDIAGFREEELAWVNAFTVAGEPRTLPDPGPFTRVIALGKNAENALLDQGISNFVAVPHPQYWRRFRHADIVGYAEQLGVARSQS